MPSVRTGNLLLGSNFDDAVDLSQWTQVAGTWEAVASADVGDPFGDDQPAVVGQAHHHGILEADGLDLSSCGDVLHAGIVRHGGRKSSAGP